MLEGDVHAHQRGRHSQPDVVKVAVEGVH
jgi:hypothetical protein